MRMLSLIGRTIGGLLLAMLLATAAHGQSVGIGTNTPNNAAILHLQSSNKGLLLPTVSLTSNGDAATIPLPPTGLMVWHGNKTTLQGQGVYFNNGNAATVDWLKLGSRNDLWSLSGNSGTDGAKLGHLDFRPLQLVVGNQHIGRLGGNNNILLGFNSGNNLSQTEDFGSHNNILIGNDAMAIATAGTNNIALGHSAMSEATGGITAIAIGTSVLRNQAAGASDNIGIGVSALRQTLTGTYNIAVGRQALYFNTTGSRNIGIGFGALEWNNIGIGAIAIGDQAMNNMRITAADPNGNIAVGYQAMQGSAVQTNNTGISNIGMGMDALRNLASGSDNVAVGRAALRNLGTGSRNVAMGHFAGVNTEGSNNLMLGAATGVFPATRTISGSIFIGTNAGRFETTSNKLYIDNAGGTAFDALIYGDLANGLFRINGRQQLKGAGVNTGIEFNYNNPKAAGAGLIGYGLLEADRLELFGGAAPAGQRQIRMYAEGGTFFTGPLIATSNEAHDLGNNLLRWNLLFARSVNANGLILSQADGDNTGIIMGHNVAGKQADAGKIQYGGFGGGTHALNIVGGGTSGTNRAIKLWSEGGLRTRGNHLPDLDNVYSLGQSGLRWSIIWSFNSTIQTSDANLKTNIAPSPYGLNEVLQMNPVQYNWKEQPDGKKEVGLLAQDVLKLIPEAVVVPEDGSAMGMKYSELIPVLIKAIQEQQQRIEKLEKKLALQHEQ